MSRFGYTATDALMSHVASCLPDDRGPSRFYYRPRKNELCAIIAGRVEGVEGALAAAARDIHETLKPSRIELGFGTAVVPQEADDAGRSARAGRLSRDRRRRRRAGAPCESQRRASPAQVGVLRPSG